MQSDEQKPKPSGYAKYLRYYSIGIQFFLGIGLFTFAGIWLDRKLGTVVLFTVLGLAIGFAGALRSVYADLYGKSGRNRERVREGTNDDASGGKSGAGDGPRATA